MFDENEVNRDQGGRFDKKHGLTADITLPVASEPVPVTIEYDQWSGQPYASEYSAVAQDYDLRPVLDTFSTADLRDFVENPQDADEVFWRAVTSGLVDEKAAQHGFEVRLDGTREYIRQREAAGQEDALTEEVILDAKRRADVYHRYAVEGASAMAEGIFTEKTGVEGFGEVHAAVEKSHELLNNIIVNDEEAVSPALRDAVAGTHALMERGRDIESDEQWGEDAPAFDDYIVAARKQYMKNLGALVEEPTDAPEYTDYIRRRVAGDNEGGEQ